MYEEKASRVSRRENFYVGSEGLAKGAKHVHL